MNDVPSQPVILGMPGHRSRPRVRDHLVGVTAVDDLTPWYRRVTVDARGLFERWQPDPGAYLLLNLTTDQGAPVQRSYTIRDLTPTSFCFEFVMHDQAGPGCRWAAAAEPGQTLSVSEPPYNLRIPEVSQALLIADPTALPAVASLAVAAGEQMKLTVLVEDNHPDHDQIPLPLSDKAVRWVDVATEACLDEVTAPLDPQDCFLWAAGGRTLAKTVREYARSRFLVPRPAQHIQTYWVG